MAKKKQKAAQAGGPAYRLGIDLGGTKILAALVDADGKIIAEAKKKTRPALGPDGVIERIVATAKEAVAAGGATLDDVLAVGIGAPGPVIFDTGVVCDAPNLPGWDSIPLGDRLKRSLNVPVFVDNDVNLGTLGEYMLGAGRGVQDMVGVFIGTGIGGGVVIDGRLHRGARNAAGEVGHTIVLPDGPQCGCGRRGCVEALASRTAIEREVRAGLAAGRSSLLSELLAQEQDRLTSGVIKRAMDQDDELMKEVLGRAQFYLSLLAANLVNLLDPQMIVFGGGVVEALGDSFLAPIQQMAQTYYIQQRDADSIRYVCATLGDHAGVLGGAMLAAAIVERKA